MRSSIAAQSLPSACPGDLARAVDGEGVVIGMAALSRFREHPTMAL
jgi:hypothetical protein